jgi:Phage integrase family
LPRIKLYDLRHTSATLLLAADVNIKIVSQRLGHTDIAITLRHYQGFMPGMQERAVAALASAMQLPTGCPTPDGQNTTESDYNWLSPFYLGRVTERQTLGT